MPSRILRSFRVPLAALLTLALAFLALSSAATAPIQAQVPACAGAGGGPAVIAVGAPNPVDNVECNHPPTGAEPQARPNPQVIAATITVPNGGTPQLDVYDPRPSPLTGGHASVWVTVVNATCTTPAATFNELVVLDATTNAVAKVFGNVACTTGSAPNPQPTSGVIADLCNPTQPIVDPNVPNIYIAVNLPCAAGTPQGGVLIVSDQTGAEASVVTNPAVKSALFIAQGGAASTGGYKPLGGGTSNPNVYGTDQTGRQAFWFNPAGPGAVLNIIPDPNGLLFGPAQLPGASPFGVVGVTVDSNTNIVLFSMSFGNYLVRVNGSTNQIDPTTPTVAIQPGVLDTTGSLQQQDVNLGTLYLIFDPGTGLVYTAPLGGPISVIQNDTTMLPFMPTLSGASESMAVDSAKHLLIVTNLEYGGVTVLNDQTGEIVANLGNNLTPPIGGTLGGAVNPVAGTTYILDITNKTIVVFNGV